MHADFLVEQDPSVGLTGMQFARTGSIVTRFMIRGNTLCSDKWPILSWSKVIKG